MRRWRPIAVGLFLAPLLACGKEEPSKGSSAAVAEEPALIRIRTREDRVVASFRRSGPKVRVEFDAGGEHLLVGEGPAEARRFTLDGADFATAKVEGSVITLTRPAGELLWQIQAAGKRIRLGKGPAEPERFVLARREQDRLKVLAGTEELGRVTFDRGEGRVKVRQPSGEPLYHASAPELSAMFGVLLLPDLPPAERYLLMAEILGQGL